MYQTGGFNISLPIYQIIKVLEKDGTEGMGAWIFQVLSSPTPKANVKSTFGLFPPPPLLLCPNASGKNQAVVSTPSTRIQILVWRHL